MKKTTKNLTDQEKEAYALVGRHGGRATYKKWGKSHMSELGKKGAKKRWLKGRRNISSKKTKSRW